MIVDIGTQYTMQINKQDADLLNVRWRLVRGYATGGSRMRGLERKYGTRLIHRIILQRKLGRSLAKGELADHVNRDTTDNRRRNLRLATFQQNVWNQRSKQGFTGVSRQPNGTFQARMLVSGLRYSIGTFATAEEAAWMRDQWALEMHGEFASTNFEYTRVSVGEVA